MFKVHKIEVENIRALGHAVFEPLVDGGMTAVNGPNGSGKSSILTAMLWAIYGVTPDGVPQNAMRRQGSEGPCRAIVEFEHQDQIITVERGLKGRNDSPYIIIHVNGVEQAKGRIKASEAWLVNLLGGLDAEGFMTAFVIRQKELDGLVKAKPSERRKLIERLAGIDRMSTAVQSARREESEVKQRLDLLPGNPEAVKAAREAVEVAQARAVELWETYEAAAADAEQQQTVLADAEAAATLMQERVEAHAHAEQAATTARHALAIARERYEAAHREVEATTTAAHGGSSDEVTAAQEALNAANTALQANQQAREGADRAVEAARQDAARATQATERATRAAAQATAARGNAERAAQQAAGFPDDLNNQVATAETELGETTKQVGALRAEHGRVAASIRAMEATSDTDSHCPTCATVLTDPSLVLSSLRETLSRVEGEGRAANEQAAALEAKVRALRDQAAAAAAAATEARHLAAQAEQAATTATETERDAAEATQAARESHERAEAAKAAALTAAQQTTTLVAAAQEAANTLRTAQVAAAAAERLPALRATAASAQNAVATAQEAYDNTARDEAAARIDPTERDTIVAAYRHAQQGAANTERTKVEAHGNFRVAEEQVKSAEKTRDAENLRMRARAEAHELLEQKTAVREALDFFRKDRIASLAPELSEIATDQIARMTDGKFVAVELDEEFTPVVTDAQGRQRPASWLSGGEESAVALSLRLAIGEVIAGTQGGLLWMDEPQTAMDAARRPAMMSVIRDLPGRQPIIISHVTEATDMVDQVVEVVPDEEVGSTVVGTLDTTGADVALLETLNA